jgi:hypothetical protein
MPRQSRIGSGRLAQGQRRIPGVEPLDSHQMLPGGPQQHDPRTSVLPVLPADLTLDPARLSETERHRTWMLNRQHYTRKALLPKPFHSYWIDLLYHQTPALLPERTPLLRVFDNERRKGRNTEAVSAASL